MRLGGRQADDYAERLSSEREIYRDQEVVHDLPPIQGYWGETHLRPIFETMGLENDGAFLRDGLLRAHARRRHGRPARFASIGSGNCDLEVALARDLVAAGCTDFRLECLDINEDMLERGRALALDAGVEEQVVPVMADFNDWTPVHSYDAFVANQSLHHVLALEPLLDGVRESLTAEGRFLISDIIGRNGHLRWPEARAIVDEFWEELPESYRYHTLLRRQEDSYMDWDCSQEGFEGIRAQDILPLLLERFGFEVFLGYANVIDPFVDRGFGPHFDPEREWDRDFIDRVHARDVEELQNGTLTPTHMVASLTAGPWPAARVWGNLTPERALRVPD